MQKLLVLFFALFFILLVPVAVQAQEQVEPTVVVQVNQVIRFEHPRYGVYFIKVAPSQQATDRYGRPYQDGHTIWYSIQNRRGTSDFYPAGPGAGCRQYQPNEKCRFVLRGVYFVILPEQRQINVNVYVQPDSGWTYTVQ